MHPVAVLAVVAGFHNVGLTVDLYLAPEVLPMVRAASVIAVCIRSSAIAAYKVCIVAEIEHHRNECAVIAVALTKLIIEDAVYIRERTVLHHSHYLCPAAVCNGSVPDVLIYPVERISDLFSLAHRACEMLLGKLFKRCPVLCCEHLDVIV